MKQLWLFSCGLGWSEEKRLEYWRRNIELAVGTGAGLFVHEVFDGDNELAGEALKWMMQFDHNQDFTPSHFFMVPRYTNPSSSSDEGVEDIESVGDGGGCVEDEEEGREQEEERGPSRVEERLVTNSSLLCLCCDQARHRRHACLDRSPTTGPAGDLSGFWITRPLSLPFLRGCEEGVCVFCALCACCVDLRLSLPPYLARHMAPSHGRPRPCEHYHPLSSPHLSHHYMRRRHYTSKKAS